MLAPSPFPDPESVNDNPSRLSPRSAVRTRRVLLGTGTVGCLLVGGYGVALAASGFTLVPVNVAGNGLPAAVHLHIVTASVALLALPWQLMPAIRRRLPRLHRWIGRCYVVAAVPAGLSGVAAGVTTSGGLAAGLGFVLLGCLWTFCTLAMYRAARRRQFAAHRRWAVRSFALAFAAVTLRSLLPVALATGLSFEQSYAVIAWLSWIPNLAVAEWHLRRSSRDPETVAATVPVLARPASRSGA